MRKYNSKNILEPIPLKNQSGFTLIEMIAAITLLGVMGLFSTQFLTGAAQTTSLASAQKGLMDDSKLAMEFMIREIRVASTTITGGQPIDITGNNQITFDKLSALAVDGDLTQIQYIQVGSNINRISSNQTTVMATNVASGGLNITANNNFYTISMTLAGTNGENFTLVSGVRPRDTTQ